MKNKLITLSGVILAAALSSCSSPYEDWEAPNIVRRNQPAVRNAPSSQVQPEFGSPTSIRKPVSSRRAQVQPTFTEPAPKPQPAAKPEAPKPQPTVIVRKKRSRSSQVQPELTTTTPAAQPKPVAQPKPAAQPAKPAQQQPVVVVRKRRGRSAQVQPTMTTTTVAPKPQTTTRTATPSQRAVGVSLPVMSQEDRKKHPVMPGQNRALKRRR